jgi:hypothetical protein
VLLPDIITEQPIFFSTRYNVNALLVAGLILRPLRRRGLGQKAMRLELGRASQSVLRLTSRQIWALLPYLYWSFAVSPHLGLVAAHVAILSSCRQYVSGPSRRNAVVAVLMVLADGAGVVIGSGRYTLRMPPACGDESLCSNSCMASWARAVQSYYRS